MAEVTRKRKRLRTCTNNLYRSFSANSRIDVFPGNWRAVPAAALQVVAAGVAQERALSPKQGCQVFYQQLRPVLELLLEGCVSLANGVERLHRGSKPDPISCQSRPGSLHSSVSHLSQSSKALPGLPRSSSAPSSFGRKVVCTP